MIRKITCVFLAVLMVSGPICLHSSAAEVVQNAYISEISIGSWEDLEKAGYMVSSAKFGDLLGSGNFIGYKITFDKSKAITDVRAMHMYGGFEKFDLDTLMNENANNSERTINGILTALKEFRANFAAKSKPAMLAYTTLNFLVVPGMNGGEDTLLGDYLLSNDRTRDDIRDLLIISDIVVSTYITEQLALAVSDDLSANVEEGADEMCPVALSWLDRLVENGPLEDNVTDTEELAELIEKYDKTYYQDTFSIIQSIRTFASNVTGALSRHDSMEDALNALKDTEDKTDDTSLVEQVEGTEALNQDAVDANVLMVYEYLNARDEDGTVVYPYGYHEDGTERSFGEFLIEIGSMNEETEDYKARRLLYPLIAEQAGTTPMTEGQWAVLKVTDFITFLKSTIFTRGDYAKAEKEIAEKGAEMIAYNDGKAISVWMGVNYELFKADGVYMTSEAIKAAAANGQYGILTKTTVKDETKQRFLWNMMLNMGVVAAIAITSAVIIAKVGAFLGGVFTLATTLGGLTCSVLGGVVAICSAIVTISIVVAGIAILAGLVIFLIWLFGEEEEKEKEEEAKRIKMLDIPAVLMDARYDAEENIQVVEYRSVKAPGSAIAQNLNRSYDNTPWLVLYTATNEAAGEPLSATALDGSSIDPFAIQTMTSQAVDKYCNLSFFAENVSANLLEGTGSIYSAFGYFHRANDAASPTFSISNGKYIGNLMLSSGYTESEAVSNIRKHEGFQVVNQNLTPNSGLYTCIGYSTTNSVENALKDIRVAYGAANEETIKTASITFNGVQYANYGNVGLLGLYASPSSNCGSPILADNLIVTRTLGGAPDTYEAVNSFSGGPAFDFNCSGNFDPGPYAGDGNSLGISADAWNTHVYVYFHPESIETDGNVYIGGLAFFDSRYSPEGWTRLSDVNVAGNEQRVTYLYYSTTRNKKRAITDVKYYQAEPNARGVAYNLSYGTEGQYVAVDVYSQGPRLYDKETGELSYWSFVRLLRSSHCYRSNIYYEGGGFFDGITADDRKTMVSDNEDMEYRNYVMYNEYNQGTYMLLGTPILATALYVRGYVPGGAEPLKVGDLVARTTPGYDSTAETPVRNFIEPYSSSGPNLAYQGAASGYTVSGTRVLRYMRGLGTDQKVVKENLPFSFTLESSRGYGSLYLFIKRADAYANRATYIKSVTVSYSGDKRSSGTNGDYGAMYKSSDGKTDLYDTPYDSMYYKFISLGPGQLVRINLASGTGGSNRTSTSLRANTQYGTDGWAEAITWNQSMGETDNEETSAWEVHNNEKKFIDWEIISVTVNNARPRLSGNYSTEVAYLWITYTDVVNQAVSDLLIYETTDPSTAKNEKTFQYGETSVTAVLGGNEGWKEDPGSNKRYYLYQVYNNGHEITDLTLSQDAFIYGWQTCLSSEGKASSYSKYFFVAKHAKSILSRTYVYKIVLAEGNTDREAQINLLNQGCGICIPYNINVSTNGKPTYMGYRTTTKSKNAYTGLILWNTQQEDNVTTVEYGRVTYDLISGNLNSGIEGYSVYLYATKSAAFNSIYQGSSKSRYITDIVFFHTDKLNEYAKDPSKIEVDYSIYPEDVKENIRRMIFDDRGNTVYWTLVRGKDQKPVNLNVGADETEGGRNQRVFMYVHYSDNYCEGSDSQTGSIFTKPSVIIVLSMSGVILLAVVVLLLVKRKKKAMRSDTSR